MSWISCGYHILPALVLGSKYARISASIFYSTATWQFYNSGTLRKHYMPHEADKLASVGIPSDGKKTRDKWWRHIDLPPHVKIKFTRVQADLGRSRNRCPNRAHDQSTTIAVPVIHFSVTCLQQVWKTSTYKRNLLVGFSVAAGPPVSRALKD